VQKPLSPKEEGRLLYFDGREAGKDGTADDAQQYYSLAKAPEEAFVRRIGTASLDPYRSAPSL
jgi:hypothetical protein